MICVISNRHLVKDDFISRVQQIGRAGVDVFVLREKELTVEQYMELALQCKEAFINSKTEFFGHLHYEEIYKAGIQNIHVPYGIFMEHAEFITKHYKKYAVSIHSVEEAVSLQAYAPYYITAGNIYETDCKKGLKGRGLVFANQVSHSNRAPVLGIGGVDLSRIGELKQAGCYGACIMSAMMQTPEPYDLALEFMKEDRKYSK